MEHEVIQTESPIEGYVLETEKGITTVADVVVAKMAGIAAGEVEGVHELGTSFRRLLGRVSPAESLTRGVNVEVGKRETAIDLVVVVDYGYSIPEVAKHLRENVITRVETGTGLIVKEVNIEVTDLFVPGGETEPSTTPRVE